MISEKFSLFKRFDGRRWNYYFNGSLFRSSLRNYRFGCVVTSLSSGRSKLVSLGNKESSTLQSMACVYKYCYDMEVFEFLEN